jgi:hypothetical protein
MIGRKLRYLEAMWEPSPKDGSCRHPRGSLATTRHNSERRRASRAETRSLIKSAATHAAKATKSQGRKRTLPMVPKAIRPPWGDEEQVTDNRHNRYDHQSERPANGCKKRPEEKAIACLLNRCGGFAHRSEPTKNPACRGTTGFNHPSLEGSKFGHRPRLAQLSQDALFLSVRSGLVKNKMRTRRKTAVFAGCLRRQKGDFPEGFH